MEFLTLWVSTFGLIFALIDPPGYVPLFLSITASYSAERRKKILLRACFVAFCVLSTFSIFGNGILSFFGISIPALQISGGLILLVLGFEMLGLIYFPERLSTSEESEAAHKDDISIVPLAIPMLSGPASIVAVVVLASKEQSLANLVAIVSSVFLTLVLTYFILRSADWIFSHIGVIGVKVLTRIMGLLLSAMAIQFILDGLSAARIFSTN